jgi:hypothetical protein
MYRISKTLQGDIDVRDENGELLWWAPYDDYYENLNGDGMYIFHAYCEKADGISINKSTTCKCGITLPDHILNQILLWAIDR